MGGDVDVAAVAALMAEPARARMLLALDRDRALPASVLAAESGVAASTASGHLARLLDAGFLSVEEHGRHRYYRLAEPAVAEVLETMARLAPTTEIRSLRQGTRAEALRRARSCYDHLAGRAGTAVMAALLDRGWLAGGDGRFHADAGGRDRPSAPGWDVDYRLTPAGLAGFRSLRIDPEALPGRRPLIRYCVDWSEQRHHLAGKLGAALLDRLHELGWVRRAATHRALTVTDEGRDGLRSAFGVDLDDT
ncbi:MAG TPA: helix-turn-helix domain-containing protein [Acidimicrobiia bacterium]|nr:helix-turn-helix domain-containing protein [Acidimicrobiia bacterium]